METSVTIKCRKSDEEMIKGMLEEIKTIYTQKIKNEVPKIKKIECELTIDNENYLPEFNKEGTGLASCLGGVELMAHRNRIVCNNTLEARLELCYQDALPEIRDILFVTKP